MNKSLKFILRYYAILIPVLTIYFVCIFNETRGFLEEFFVGGIFGVLITAFMSLLPQNKEILDPED